MTFFGEYLDHSLRQLGVNPQRQKVQENKPVAQSPSNLFQGEGGQPGLLVEPKIGSPSEQLAQPVSGVKGGNIFVAVRSGGGGE